MDFDLDIGYCDYDWYLPYWLVLELWYDGTVYKPETFPPPCTASNYTGLIGYN